MASAKEISATYDAQAGGRRASHWATYVKRMPNHHLVSIVVPTLNRARFLVPTLESILQQDYPNLECVVVDGGSNDGTIEILKSYGTRIRWVSEPDRGHADAINKGWKMSRGQVLAWLNADDVYAAPDVVWKAVKFLEENPGADLVYGDYAFVDEEGKVISDILRPRRWDLFRAVKYCDWTIPQPASFIRRGVLEKVNWLDPSFIQKKDHELWLRIGLAGTIRYTPGVFAYARDCPGISQKGDEVAWACVRLTENFFAFPNLPVPLQRAQFRRRALSNAYLVGALYAFPGVNGGHRRMAVKYLLKACALDFLNVPFILSRFAGSVLVSSLKGLIRVTSKLLKAGDDGRP